MISTLGSSELTTMIADALQDIDEKSISCTIDMTGVPNIKSTSDLENKPIFIINKDVEFNFTEMMDDALRDTEEKPISCAIKVTNVSRNSKSISKVESGPISTTNKDVELNTSSIMVGDQVVCILQFYIISSIFLIYVCMFIHI